MLFFTADSTTHFSGVVRVACVVAIVVLFVNSTAFVENYHLAVITEEHLTGLVLFFYLVGMWFSYAIMEVVSSVVFFI